MNWALALLVLLSAGSFSACSTGYKNQAYAKLSNTKEFEEEYPTVWKGAIAALSEYKVEEKDQEKGIIKTDWIYTTSNEKYLEYTVNGFPRKKYLQTRYKFLISLEKKMGLVRVTVNPEQEIEKLKSDGSFDSWQSVSDFDTSRANELLRNIELKILSRPST